MHHYRRHFPELADVPENGREYTQGKFKALRTEKPDALLSDKVWTVEDFARIGARQNELENAAAEVCPLVIADTDSLATTLWERFYNGEGSFGSYNPAAHLPRRDLYLITDHVGVPFKDDGWREGEPCRAEMTEWFRETLTEEGHSWIVLTGDMVARAKTAIQVTDLMLAHRSSFTCPWSQRSVLEGARA